MSHIYIHIGTHKTATTHIQTFFEKNAFVLARAGVIFPKIENSERHHALAGVWNEYLCDDPEAMRSEWRALAARYGPTNKTVFISSEELGRFRPASLQTNLTELRALLEGFDQITLLCCFRNQAGFMQSIYQQITGNRGGAAWKPFYKKALRARACDGLSLDYNRFYTHLLKGFDRRDIRLLSYDTAITEPGGIIGAVLREIGCDLSPALMRGVAQEHSNISAPPLASLIANQIAAPRVARARLQRLVSDQINSYFDTPKRTTLFHQSELDQMTDIFEPTNTALANRVSPFQPDFAVGPMLPQGADVTRDMLDEGFWIALSRRLAREAPI